MTPNEQISRDIKKFIGNVIIVEGKKDIVSLKALGFKRIYAIYKPSVSIKERIEYIAKEISRNDRVCILTDFDRKGKYLYKLIKKLCQELGIKTDSSLRSLLLKAHISHIEGLYKALNN